MNDGWLTNYEVYASLIADHSRILEKEVKKPSNSVAIQNQVLRYLKDYTPVESMNSDSIKQTMGELEKFNLAESETFEILNHAPQHDVFTYMLIPQARLSDAQDEEKWRSISHITTTFLLVQDTEANKKALYTEIKSIYDLGTIV